MNRKCVRNAREKTEQLLVKKLLLKKKKACLISEAAKSVQETDVSFEIHKSNDQMKMLEQKLKAGAARDEKPSQIALGAHLEEQSASRQEMRKSFSSVHTKFLDKILEERVPRQTSLRLRFQ